MIDSFKSALGATDLFTKDTIIADGKLHRFTVEGDKPGSKNGWYVLYGDGLAAGAFGSWKTGYKATWCAKAENSLTIAEREEYRRRMYVAWKIRETEEQARRKAASNRASDLWKVLPSAPDHHAYLVKKGIRNHGLRLHKGMLVIPMRDSTGHLHSLQFIDGEGNKRFLKDGRKKGCYFVIGVPVDFLCIAEGYATAASIHESTDLPVAVAFDAGNLLSVAQVLRTKYAEIEMTLCADNDTKTPGNPGLTKAREAAAACGALLAVPPGPGDFNDLYRGTGDDR